MMDNGVLKLVVGGKAYELPPMTLRTLKIAWPIISKLSAIGDQQTPLMTSTDFEDRAKLMELHSERLDLIAAIMISAGRASGLTKEIVENEMTYDETTRMLEDFNSLLRISGLERSEDPLQPGAENVVQLASNPANSTGTPSRLN